MACCSSMTAKSSTGADSPPPRVLRVSRRDLLFALENRVPGIAHYLDTTTGDVIPVFGFNRQRILADVRAAPRRYIRLAPQSGAEGYSIMESFVRTVSRPEIRARLQAALQTPPVFRSFRQVLETLPGEMERWLNFRAECGIDIIRNQLSATGVALELVDE